MPWRDELSSDHEERKREQLWRQRSAITSPQGVEVSVDGKQFLNFCSNDYLGLAHHPDVIAAAVSATQQRGTGSGASHLICGHSDEHHQLEQQIAGFVGAEQAIVFSTGYMANLAIPQTFLGRDDLIIQDRLNHASLIDGGRYCEAKMKRYPHCDVAAVDKLLTQSHAPRKLVTTDGVFSMDGTIAPVQKLKTICDDQQAMLVVDDAHGHWENQPAASAPSLPAMLSISKRWFNLPEPTSTPPPCPLRSSLPPARRSRSSPASLSAARN